MKHNLPWVREWEQLEQDSDSVMIGFLYGLVFVVLCIAMAFIFVDGLDRQALADQQYAEGKRAGRVEMLERVKQETEEEERTWAAFYRAAGTAGMSGFDGVVLVGNRQ
jgi:hypothetical protein